MYRCKSCTIKKAECWRIDAFELWCWRTLESPLDCKEIKPVNPKGNQSWIFIGRTDVEAETPILSSPDAKNSFLGKIWFWARLKAGGEGDDIGWDGWMVSPTRWTGVWENPRKEWRTEEPGMLQSLGSQRVGHEWATEQQWQWCQCYMGAKPGLLGGGNLWWNRISQASEGVPGRGGRLWKWFLLVALSLRD